jgi:transcriptional regulator
MYQPEHFRLEDRDALHAVMRAHPLAQLVTAGPGGLMANAIPFILHADEGENGVLRSHLARPNPQWREIEAGADVLVIFQGPEAYVTPGWYPSKREHGKVVPTWNYVAVQARGRAVAIQDGAWLHAHVSQLSDVHEQTREMPWSVSDAPDAFIHALTRGIVGIEITISALTGKFKMSQNRPAADRDGVADGLHADGAADMAGLVRALGEGRP